MNELSQLRPVLLVQAGNVVLSRPSGRRVRTHCRSTARGVRPGRRLNRLEIEGYWLKLDDIFYKISTTLP